MSKKMTIAYFKEAIKQDGNISFGVNRLLYVLRQIEYAHADGQITDKQMDKLWRWAYLLFDHLHEHIQFVLKHTVSD